MSGRSSFAGVAKTLRSKLLIFPDFSRFQSIADRGIQLLDDRLRHARRSENPNHDNGALKVGKSALIVGIRAAGNSVPAS